MRILHNHRRRRHCFPLPVLVEKIHLLGPGPINFPELELATAILQLVNAAKSQLTRQVSEVATLRVDQPRASRSNCSDRRRKTESSKTKRYPAAETVNLDLDLYLGGGRRT